MATPTSPQSLSESQPATQTHTPESTSSSSTQESAMKTRIITHMNKSHSDSLSLYLQYYVHVPASQSQSPTLQDVTLESLVINADDGTWYTVPVSPPMSDWSEIRPRVIAMDKEARAGLGLGEIEGGGEEGHGHGDGHGHEHRANGHSSAKTTDLSPTPYIPYTFPTAPLQLLTLAALLFFTLTLLPSPLTIHLPFPVSNPLTSTPTTTTTTLSIPLPLSSSLLTPGSWYHTHVMSWFPIYGAEGYALLQRSLRLPVLGIHVTEMALMVKRLGDVGIGVGEGVRRADWWVWVASTLLEGWGAHVRFGEAVRGLGLQGKIKDN